MITGPNGSGKSTLLAILCGLLRPTRGTVRHVLNGDETAREEWRWHLGVVAPAMSVYEELDAMENLRFFARVRGMYEGDSGATNASSSWASNRTAERRSAATPLAWRSGSRSHRRSSMIPRFSSSTSPGQISTRQAKAGLESMFMGLPQVARRWCWRLMIEKK